MANASGAQGLRVDAADAAIGQLAVDHNGGNRANANLFRSLCDLRMPHVDGYGLLKLLRTDSALDDVVVVAVTAYSMPDDHRRVREAGFDGHLTKPIEPRTFVADVEKFIAAGRGGNGHGGDGHGGNGRSDQH